jgi:cytochrome c-type biogenesis protein CcmH/NrfF
LLVGIGIIVIVIRRRGTFPLTAPENLTAAEQARVAELLRGEGSP